MGNDRAIEGGDIGKYSVAGCLEEAKGSGNKFFAVQNGEDCWTSPTAGDTYDKHGLAADGCCSDQGTGGFNCQEVYEIGNFIFLTLKGCWYKIHYVQ